MKTNYGKIEVSEELYTQFWEFIKKYHFVPYRVEYMFCSKTFMIEAECALFRVVKERDIIPKYLLEIETQLTPKHILSVKEETK